MSGFCSHPDCERFAFINGLCYSHDNELKKEAKEKLKVKKVCKIPAKSKKQIVKDKALHKVYDKMDNGEEVYCTGCGQTQALTHSHLLPRSLFKEHESNPVNITYHCLTCHGLWETLLSVYLLDYTDNMNKMKTLEPNYVISLAQKQHNYFIDRPEYLKLITPFLV